MVSVPLGRGDWRRAVANEAEIPVLNRYFEANPLTEEQAALLSRPALRRWKSIGDGPIRAVYSQPGTFDEALFVISGNSLYRIEQDESTTLLGNGFSGGTEDPSVSMVATAEVGDLPAHLFIADGGVLWLYVDNAYALGTLTGTPANNDVVKIDTIYYKFTSGSVATGTPAGTLANPWLVALGAAPVDSFTNLADAISASGTPGTTYSSALTAHTLVAPVAYTSTILGIQALTAGATGNGISTTETGAALAWGGATLAGGGGSSLTQVQTPDDVGIISVGHISGYVIVVVAQGYGLNGRFYWVRPGATTIDALDFATAERAPDALHAVRVIGDQFWLFGTNSTEIWYMSGVADSPFIRVQARLFERGIWGGTDVQIKDAVIIVDTDGVVYSVGGGSPQRISDHSIEERIRKSIRRTELADSI